MILIIKLQDVLPEQNADIPEDLNSNQGIYPLKSCIPCCCKPSQVENVSRYVLILISNYCEKAIEIKKYICTSICFDVTKQFQVN